LFEEKLQKKFTKFEDKRGKARGGSHEGFFLRGGDRCGSRGWCEDKSGLKGDFHGGCGVIEVVPVEVLMEEEVVQEEEDFKIVKLKKFLFSNFICFFFFIVFGFV
jgi:hypothetical protein